MLVVGHLSATSGLIGAARFELAASCLQNRRSPAELRPQRFENTVHEETGGLPPKWAIMGALYPLIDCG